MAKKNREREDRINYDIIVDAYGPEERAMAWYYYLQDMLRPFTARCVRQRESSPLRSGDEVEVSGMASEAQCRHEMFVLIRRDGHRSLAVPLAQLKPIGNVDEPTRQAVQDWQYWVKQGYEL